MARAAARCAGLASRPARDRFETRGAKIFTDPWQARNNYIDVILDRSAESIGRFLRTHTPRDLSAAERITAWKLLELQRHAMLMYTSCGWFFDELSGIETVQVIQYAARALQLAQELFGDGIEAGFLERLEAAKSNLPEHRDGRLIFEKFVRPAVVNLEKVGAHYAISSLFEDYGERTRSTAIRSTGGIWFSSMKARHALRWDGRASPPT